MSINVGINGFDRIGKVLLKIIETSNSNIQVNTIEDFRLASYKISFFNNS